MDGGASGACSDVGYGRFGRFGMVGYGRFGGRLCSGMACWDKVRLCFGKGQSSQ